jgi:pyruvate carboxylase
VLAAVAAGADVVDGAIDAFSGLTSQPNLGSIVEALRFGPRDAGIEPQQLRTISAYWEQVRRYYGAFESDMRAGASEVYVHGMPGGQYTNLREQARGLGIADARWPEVAAAYAQVNALLGDIVKVTPTSKAVGDLALLMVSSDLSPAQLLDPAREIAFPESIVQLLRGDLGQPHGGFPPALQHKVLKGAAPHTGRPGAHLAPVDLAAERARIQQQLPRPVSDEDLASHLMYPRVWLEYARARALYGDPTDLPTPVFFYGMEPGQEISVDLERGKTLIVRYLASSEPHEDGTRTVFFELNGQPRSVRVADRTQVLEHAPPRKAESGNASHVGAPMPGVVTSVAAAVGARVERGQLLLTLEAMKMETAVRASAAGEVAEVLVRAGQAVEARDLLVILR